MENRRKKKIKYSDEPLELKPTLDFLPPPKNLILKEKTGNNSAGGKQKKA